MTTKIKLIETFDETPTVSLTTDSHISEDINDSRVDGKYIIGMIEGQFFKPDGMSRNKRWYPRSLWEKALNSADVKNRFLTSTMFGEIGHSDGPVEDMTLRTGCASHFIDKLWITEDGKGMGRAYILNTPTGNLLKTYLGAGCKLKVSTRGEGIYKEGCTHEGCPVVDDETYELQTADFVLNPGFLETSATLREAYEETLKNIQNKEIIKETLAHVTKEGETKMTLDIDAYVRELKEELKLAKAKNESLMEELKAKETELLQKQFNESAEVKKLNEALAPFKKMKVSAKTLNETLKRSQDALKKAKAEKTKIAEELEAYKAKCGSLETIDEATKMSSKALAKIREYQEFGSVEDLKTYFKNSQKILERLKEAKKLEANATKLLEYCKESKKVSETAQKALRILEQYRKAVGPISKLKSNNSKIVESTPNKKSLLKEALSVSKKYGCTVESAAKLVKRHGVERTCKLLESATKKVNKSKLISGKKLVEEVAQLDKVNNVPAEKTAKDFLKPGMVTNYFNNAALGKSFEGKDINDIDGSIAQKPNAAKELLKKYKDIFPVEAAPQGLKKEITPAQAEAEAKKLLK